MQVKTIDIDIKEWFDRLAGNSYFAGTVTVNFGMKSAKSFNLPFEYGYGSHSEHMALRKLKTEKVVNSEQWHELHDQGIIIRSNKQENCLKRELMEYK